MNSERLMDPEIAFLEKVTRSAGDLLQLSFLMDTDACILPTTTFFDMVVDTFFLV